MKNYRVYYYFDGRGEVVIKAKSKKDAENKFYEGEFENENEYGESYVFENAEIE